MTLEAVVPAPFEAFPDLEPLAREEFSYYGDSPLDPYPVFSCVLRPAVYAALDSGDQSAARRFLDFYERIASDPNEDVNALSSIELIEQLANDPARLRRAWPLMGPSIRGQALRYACETTRQFGKNIWLPE